MVELDSAVAQKAVMKTAETVCLVSGLASLGSEDGSAAYSEAAAVEEKVEVDLAVAELAALAELAAVAG